MEKGIVKKLENQNDFLYFHIEANASVVYLLDEISAAIDDYEEGLSYPEKNINYETFVPKRVSFNVGDGTTYAIVIFNKDQIDLILFKNNSKFDAFLGLMKEKFSYSNGESL